MPKCFISTVRDYRTGTYCSVGGKCCSVDRSPTTLKITFTADTCHHMLFVMNRTAFQMRILEWDRSDGLSLYSISLFMYGAPQMPTSRKIHKVLSSVWDQLSRTSTLSSVCAILSDVFTATTAVTTADGGGKMAE